MWRAEWFSWGKFAPLEVGRRRRRGRRERRRRRRKMGRTEDGLETTVLVTRSPQAR